MKLCIVFFLLLFTAQVSAQDIAAAKAMVKTLSAAPFWGRGYTKQGVQKVAEFLAKEFENYGLKPLNGQSYFQEFSFTVNTFPGNMKLKINGKKLIPGKDFVIQPDSRGLKARGNFKPKDSLNYYNDRMPFSVQLVGKLTWSVSQRVSEKTNILVDKRSFQQTPEKFNVNIENILISNFRSANICGMVKGTVQPDSMIFITAHYDHLGGMGKKTFFPGANDNASGVALLLSLAKYYALHPQKYSIGFICFSGEEAGLLGSKYFSENPLIDLNKIRFLVNTDLAGTGEGGITVVNGTLFKNEFDLLNLVNTEGQYLSKIYSRGKAANSDHYWFTEKGVPSFFIYTMGGIKAYHDIYDRAETLPLTEHEDLFRLLFKFNSKLMGY